jgi:hypothetical protein
MRRTLGKTQAAAFRKDQGAFLAGVGAVEWRRAADIGAAGDDSHGREVICAPPCVVLGILYRTYAGACRNDFTAHG